MFKLNVEYVKIISLLFSTPREYFFIKTDIN